MRESGHADLAAWLIEAGADVHARDHRGRTPLTRASIEGKAELVSLLLQHRADAASADVHGQTALHHASLGHLSDENKQGQVQALPLLLAASLPSLDARDEAGETPLMLACEAGHTDAAIVLISAGASLLARSHAEAGSYSPLTLAVMGKHEGVVEAILECGNAKALRLGDNRGRMPLMHAVMLVPAAKAIVKMLIAAGAPAAAINEVGESAVSLAEQEAEAACLPE